MADDAVIDLSMLLENGLIAQFEEYEIPKDTSAEFILEGLLRTVGRILKQREDLGPLPSMIVALQKLVDQIQEKSLPRSKMIRYIVCFGYSSLSRSIFISGTVRRAYLLH